jgi:hypothetical protein
MIMFMFHHAVTNTCVGPRRRADSTYDDMFLEEHVCKYNIFHAEEKWRRGYLIQIH